MLHSNMLPNDRTRALLDSVAPREQAEESGIGEAVNFALGLLRRQFICGSPRQYTRRRPRYCSGIRKLNSFSSNPCWPTHRSTPLNSNPRSRY